MNYIYIVRHGEALTKTQDLLRPLSEKGRLEVERLAHALKIKNILIDNIFFSHKKRSQETAEIIAKHLKMEAKLSLQPLLDPEDSVNQLSYFVDNLKENAMLVGHLPNLELLTAYLLNVEIDRLGFTFAPGSIACLKHLENSYSLEWFTQ